MADNTIEKLEALVAAFVSLSGAINTALDTRQAPDSAKLAGKTFQEVVEAAAAGADLSEYMKKTDDAGLLNVTYNSTTKTLAAALGGIAGDLSNFIAAKATGSDVIAGTDDAKYTTALAVKAAITKAIDDLVDGAPTALNTLKELAEALANDQDAIAAITLALDGKLGKTEQAADSALLGGKTLSQVHSGLDDFSIAPLNALVTGTSEEMAAIAVGKYVGAVNTSLMGGLPTETPPRSISIGIMSAEIYPTEYQDGAAVSVVRRLVLNSGGTPYIYESSFIQKGVLKVGGDWIKAASTGETDYLEGLIDQLSTDKLDVTAQAADSAKLEGRDVATLKSEIIGEIPASTAYLDLTTAPYNVLLKGANVSDLNAIVALGTGHYVGVVKASSLADLSPILNLTGNEGDAVLTVDVGGDWEGTGHVIRRSIAFMGPEDAVNGERVYGEWVQTCSVGGSSTVLDLWVQQADEPMVTTALSQLSSQLSDQINEILDQLDALPTKASSAEAIDGTDDEKYITALALKAKVDDAITALVNGAPEAYDTLKELADALANQDDALAALVTQLGQKLGKTEQAADSAKLEGRDVATLKTEILAAVPVSTGYVDFTNATYLPLAGVDAQAISAVANGRYTGVIATPADIGLSGGAGVMTVETFDGTVAGRPSRCATRTFVEAQGRDGLTRRWVQSVSYSSGRPNLGQWVRIPNGELDLSVSALSPLTADSYTGVVGTITDGVYSGPVNAATYAGVNPGTDDQAHLRVEVSTILLGGVSTQMIYRELRVTRATTGKVDLYTNAFQANTAIVYQTGWVGSHDGLATQADLETVVDTLTQAINDAVATISGVSTFSAVMVPTSLGAPTYGYETGGQGSLTPSTIGSVSVDEISWNTDGTTVSVFFYDHNYTATDFRSLKLNDLLSTGTPVATMDGTDTKVTFTMSSNAGIPTSGNVNVELKYVSPFA